MYRVYHLLRAHQSTTSYGRLTPAQMRRSKPIAVVGICSKLHTQRSLVAYMYNSFGTTALENFTMANRMWKAYFMIINISSVKNLVKNHLELFLNDFLASIWSSTTALTTFKVPSCAIHISHRGGGVKPMTLGKKFSLQKIVEVSYNHSLSTCFCPLSMSFVENVAENV